jgi:hypothetical protein
MFGKGVSFIAYAQVYSKICKTVDKILEKYNIEPKDFLMGKGDNILKANKEILDTLATNVGSMDHLESIRILSEETVYGYMFDENDETREGYKDQLKLQDFEVLDTLHQR